MCVTDTEDEPNVSTDCHAFPYPSGGWISGFSLTGKHFWLWRQGLSAGSSNFYSIHEWTIFEAPNQAKYAEPISDYAAKLPSLDKENLVSHTEN